MQEMLFELASSIVAAAFAVVVGFWIAKRNDHDDEDRDR